MRDVKNISEHQYLIIGGSTKCGTTSLFKYLADHPEICAATIKESRFFLNRQYPLRSRYRLEDDGIEGYENIFKKCTDGIRMEATPDYLYSDFAVNNINEYLPNSKIVFIIRDPVERLKSWYNFAKQKAMLDKDISFEEYVDQQMAASLDVKTEQHMCALIQGKYSNFLQVYLDRFGWDNIFVISFDDLISKPKLTLKRICCFAKIGDAVYEDYHFGVFNKTVAVKNEFFGRIYKKLRMELGYLFHDNQMMMSILRFINRKMYYFVQMNHDVVKKVEMPKELVVKLDDYYSEERELMDALLRKYN